MCACRVHLIKAYKVTFAIWKYFIWILMVADSSKLHLYLSWALSRSNQSFWDVLWPKSQQLTSAPVWKSKCLLPTCPSHYLLCSSFRHPSNAICSITQSITLYTFRPAIGWWSLSAHNAQRCEFPLEARGHRPCLLQILMAEFRHEPFYLLSSKGHNPGQRAEVTGAWSGYQGGVHQQGKATGAYWTV